MMGVLASLGRGLKALLRAVRRDWRVALLAFIGILFFLRLVTQ